MIDHTAVVKKDTLLKAKQKKDFDNRHGAKTQPDMSPGQFVWMKDREQEGTVITVAAPRSYEVETEDVVHRRNTSQLVSLPSEELPQGTDQHTESPIVSHDASGENANADQNSPTKNSEFTRSRRNRRPVDRLDPSWNTSRKGDVE